ncbi:hypothetical protein [Paenibacillus tianjinensis]|uniref:Uncharacterized protein n=1 Tax=Paenibacillus tianjinensis TaxID=2810347 RepID=A0ABX7L7W5_9BACL|nr:hypothetical protein [Paenibacillus tianjinensis]QSF43458.1 hypothetical protein JRJ22_19535 [Paenibacillus tianjinensis]
MINDIKNKNMDVNHVIAASLEARKEFGLKVGELIDELSKLLPKLEVGMILEAKEDCMNNFRKGQRLEITKVNQNGDYVIDGVVGTNEETIHKYFDIVNMRGE